MWASLHVKELRNGVLSSMLRTSPRASCHRCVLPKSYSPPFLQGTKFFPVISPAWYTCNFWQMFCVPQIPGHRDGGYELAGLQLREQHFWQESLLLQPPCLAEQPSRSPCGTRFALVENRDSHLCPFASLIFISLKSARRK